MYVCALALASVPSTANENVLEPVRHWSFKPLERPQIPQVKDSVWSANPIDAFVSQKHLKFNLQARPPASRHVLLRRVYLDLIGLPPTRKELREFLVDHSANAFPKGVD